MYRFETIAGRFVFKRAYFKKDYSQQFDFMDSVP